MPVKHPLHNTFNGISRSPIWIHHNLPYPHRIIHLEKHDALLAAFHQVANVLIQTCSPMK